MSINLPFLGALRLSLAGATMVAFMSATPALAGPIGTTGTLKVTRQSGYYSGSGGEFTVYDFNGALETDGYVSKTSDIGWRDPSFQTFCLESSEPAVSPSNFVIGSAAKSGGNESVNGRDPISQGTAWLYSQFAMGTLSKYFDDPDRRSTNAGLLQQAIWWLEGEDGNRDRTTNYYYNLAVTQFQGKTEAEKSAAEGFLGVYVLNNTYFEGQGKKKKEKNAQDFLYHVRVPVSTPDAGTTLALLGGALMALGAVRRQ